MRQAHGMKLSKMDFDDIFQRAVIATDRHKDTIRNEDAFLYEAVRREVLAFKMQKYQKKTEYHEEVFNEDTYEYTGSDMLVKDLINNIETLNDNQRKYIKMHFLQGKTYSEVARECNIDLESVRNFIHRGLVNLRRRLKKWNRD